jgi:SAM-dependent methyltransferase
MYSILEKQNTRPPLFSAYTAEELWTDSHIARQMLAFHLDPDQPLASRTGAFMEASLDWMIGSFGPGPESRILDLGCGPGLYANPLARTGARVTGVDFSPNSLAHARKTAQEEGLPVDYRKANYLELELEGSFDLVFLIYGDLCPLSPAQRATLLRKVAGWLAPEGRFVFDVTSRALFDSVEESASYEWARAGGFWAADPYFLFTNRFRYPEEKVFLDRHRVIEINRQREIFNWIQCFEPGTLEVELREAGLKVQELVGNLAGDPFDPGATEFGVIAGRA